MKRYFVLAFAALLGVGQSALAAPFFYDFQMPNFHSGGGTSSIRVSLDNGGISNLSENYELSDILSVQLLSLNGAGVTAPVFDNLFLSSGTLSQTLITTDALGAATWNVAGTSSAATYWGDAGASFATDYISLGIDNGLVFNSGCVYRVVYQGQNRQICANGGNILVAQGTLVPAAVPVPAGLFLLPTGIAMMAWGRNRRRAKTPSLAA